MFTKVLCLFSQKLHSVAFVGTRVAIKMHVQVQGRVRNSYSMVLGMTLKGPGTGIWGLVFNLFVSREQGRFLISSI